MKRPRAPLPYVHPAWRVAAEPPLVALVAADAAQRHARREFTGFLVAMAQGALRRLVGVR